MALLSWERSGVSWVGELVKIGFVEKTYERMLRIFKK
jgi:hypothetical protein